MYVTKKQIRRNYVDLTSKSELEFSVTDAEGRDPREFLILNNIDNLLLFSYQTNKLTIYPKIYFASQDESWEYYIKKELNRRGLYLKGITEKDSLVGQAEDGSYYCLLKLQAEIEGRTVNTGWYAKNYKQASGEYADIYIPDIANLQGKIVVNSSSLDAAKDYSLTVKDDFLYNDIFTVYFKALYEDPRTGNIVVVNTQDVTFTNNSPVEDSIELTLISDPNFLYNPMTDNTYIYNYLHNDDPLLNKWTPETALKYNVNNGCSHIQTLEIGLKVGNSLYEKTLAEGKLSDYTIKVFDWEEDGLKNLSNPSYEGTPLIPGTNNLLLAEPSFENGIQIDLKNHTQSYGILKISLYSDDVLVNSVYYSWDLLGYTLDCLFDKSMDFDYDLLLDNSSIIQTPVGNNIVELDFSNYPGNLKTNTVDLLYNNKIIEYPEAYFNIKWVFTTKNTNKKYIMTGRTIKYNLSEIFKLLNNGEDTYSIDDYIEIEILTELK